MVGCPLALVLTTGVFAKSFLKTKIQKMRYDLVVENLEAADEILFRLLENILYIEDKRDEMLEDISRIKSRIRKAELFLKHDESKQPKPPDFANTTFSEVPQVVSVENQESQQAVEGATPVVQQNEQTKEVCQIGKFQWEIPHCNMLPCQNCPHFS